MKPHRARQIEFEWPLGGEFGSMLQAKERAASFCWAPEPWHARFRWPSSPRRGAAILAISAPSAPPLPLVTFGVAQINRRPDCSSPCSILSITRARKCTQRRFFTKPWSQQLGGRLWTSCSCAGPAPPPGPRNLAPTRKMSPIQSGGTRARPLSWPASSFRRGARR